MKNTLQFWCIKHNIPSDIMNDCLHNCNSHPDDIVSEKYFKQIFGLI